MVAAGRRQGGGGGAAGRAGACGPLPLPCLTCCTAPPQIALNPERRLVLALCGTRLHVFAGGPTLEALFAAYASGIGAAEPRYVEVCCSVFGVAGCADEGLLPRAIC